MAEEATVTGSKSIPATGKNSNQFGIQFEFELIGLEEWPLMLARWLWQQN